MEEGKTALEGKSIQFTFYEKCKLIFTNITVEPIIICHILPSVMSSLAMQNLNLEKACRVDLNYTTTICNAMAHRNQSGYFKGDEETVQKLVAAAMAWKNIIQSVLPVILLLFLGAWSDRHCKRKPCILLPISGEAITAIGCLICTYFTQLPLIYNIIAESLPVGMTGVWVTMLVSTNAYISDITTTETRTLRLGALYIFTNISITLGSSLSGIIFRGTGFYGVFGIALTMNLVGLCYGFMCIKEVPQIEIKGLGKVKKQFLTDFFDYKHVIDTLSVVFKNDQEHRIRNRSRRICVIMLLVAIIIGPVIGEANVTYLLVRYKFGWNEVEYSIFYTITFVTQIIGIVSLLSLSKYLRMDDALLGVISSTSKFLASFVYAFAPNSTIFYLGVFVEMLDGTAFIALRTIISKLVPRTELGKVSSIFGVCEALIPLVYGPMYSYIYKMTINVLPGAYYLSGGLLNMLSILIFLWLYREHKHDQKEALLNKCHEEETLLF